MDRLSRSTGALHKSPSNPLMSSSPRKAQQGGAMLMRRPWAPFRTWSSHTEAVLGARGIFG